VPAVRPRIERYEPAYPRGPLRTVPFRSGRNDGMPRQPKQEKPNTGKDLSRV